MVLPSIRLFQETKAELYFGREPFAGPGAAGIGAHLPVKGVLLPPVIFLSDINRIELVK